MLICGRHWCEKLFFQVAALKKFDNILFLRYFEKCLRNHECKSLSLFLRGVPSIFFLRKRKMMNWCWIKIKSIMQEIFTQKSVLHTTSALSLYRQKLIYVRNRSLMCYRWRANGWEKEKWLCLWIKLDLKFNFHAILLILFHWC